MASKFFPIHIPINANVIIVIALLVGGLWLMTRPQQPKPLTIKLGPDGQPGNPTGKQALDYRGQAQEQYPYLVPGAIITPGGNSWI